MTSQFFITREQISNGEIYIHGTDAAHIHTVLRMKSGDPIEVLDGEGSRYQVSLTRVDRKGVEGRIVSTEPYEAESPVEIHLGLPLLKGARLDDTVRKATELGVSTLSPLATERCVARGIESRWDEKVRRWEKIAAEACKQCGRTKIPEIKKQLQSAAAFCENNRGRTLKLVFWEGEKSFRLKNLEKKTTDAIACFTGPEGGLTLGEIESARRFGFQTVTLGPRRLRAETAPTAVLSILQNLYGDL